MRLALLQDGFFRFKRLVGFFLQVFFNAFDPLRNLLVIGEDQFQIQIRSVAQRINAAFGVRNARIIKNANYVRYAVHFA